jgi:hypothetical protein
MRLFKTRVIIPKCRRSNGFYCKDSKIDNNSTSLIEHSRYKLLQEAYNYPFFNINQGKFFEIKSTNEYSKSSLDHEIINLINKNNNEFLVITSNNFFHLPLGSERVEADCSQITQKLIEKGLNKLQNKKDTILGFDIDNPINPYCGINAIVAYLHPQKDNFSIKTCIWESWICQECCNTYGFLKQNTSRTTTYNGISVILMSCGDICRYCWRNDITKIPNGEIIIDLSHMSLSGHSCQRKVPPELVKENKAKIIIVSQQVKSNNTFNRYKQNGYPYVFINSQVTKAYMNISEISNNQKAIFVDLFFVL